MTIQTLADLAGTVNPTILADMTKDLDGLHHALTVERLGGKTTLHKLAGDDPRTRENRIPALEYAIEEFKERFETIPTEPLLFTQHLLQLYNVYNLRSNEFSALANIGGDDRDTTKAGPISFNVNGRNYVIENVPWEVARMGMCLIASVLQNRAAKELNTMFLDELQSKLPKPAEPKPQVEVEEKGTYR